MRKFKKTVRRKNMKRPLTMGDVSRFFFTLLLLLVTAFILLISGALPVTLNVLSEQKTDSYEKIEWVDFDVSYEALKKAMDVDISTYYESIHTDWIDILAYLGARYGGDFTRYKASHIDELVLRIENGEHLSHITEDMKLFSYYQKAYGAVLSGFLGEFTENGEEKYGLKAFSPVAEGYWYSHFDDFGAGRSYGYDRKHFGHDLMISTGTPIVAVESGIIEALGWNQYGGWRLGIRSFDGQRYYYYAHLRKDHPYNDRIYEGMTVTAGDVIGYSGQTGYSIKENVNNIDTPHLHYGMQLIFEESEKDSPNQIWIDMYALTKLLSTHKSAVYQPSGSKEYYRAGLFTEKNYYQEQQIKEESQRLIRLYQLRDNTIVSDPAKKNPDENSALVLGETQREEVRLPIIMYHALTKEKKFQNTYFIEPDLFAADLKYLKDNGYSTVVMSDLINYVNGNAPLPENPVMLTFDDGYYNNYLYAYPLLKEYQMKAVISVVGKFTDDYSQIQDTNEYYAHLSWKHLREMAMSGIVEIQNHSYNLHLNEGGRKGVSRKKGESLESYRETVGSDISLLQKKAEEMLGQTFTTMTYPFGAYDESSEQIARELGFAATLTCYERVNIITENPECLYGLGRFLRSPDRSVEEILKGAVAQ